MASTSIPGGPPNDAALRDLVIRHDTDLRNMQSAITDVKRDMSVMREDFQDFSKTMSGHMQRISDSLAEDKVKSTEKRQPTVSSIIAIVTTFLAGCSIAGTLIGMYVALMLSPLRSETASVRTDLSKLETRAIQSDAEQSRMITLMALGKSYTDAALTSFGTAVKVRAQVVDQQLQHQEILLRLLWEKTYQQPLPAISQPPAVEFQIPSGIAPLP